MSSVKLQADFNGLFGELLCLSHRDSVLDAEGSEVVLQPGMSVMVFEKDLDNDGNRDDLIASGTVEASPDWLQCRGSRWVLRIDQHGVRHESDLRDEQLKV
jgi:hypothetical protein